MMTMMAIEEPKTCFHCGGLLVAFSEEKTCLMCGRLSTHICNDCQDLNRKQDTD